MIFVSLSELTNRCAEQWRNFSWRRVKALRRSADFNSLKRTDSEPITLKWVQCNHKGTSVQAGRRVSVRVMLYIKDYWPLLPLKMKGCYEPRNASSL